LIIKERAFAESRPASAITAQILRSNLSLANPKLRDSFYFEKKFLVCLKSIYVSDKGFKGGGEE